MSGKLGHHHVGQQACGWNTFVDDLGRNRRLNQGFALTAGPFTTYMLLDGKHARRVIQLLANVFADALKLAASSALSVFRFVTDHRAETAAAMVHVSAIAVARPVTKLGGAVSALLR